MYVLLGANGNITSQLARRLLAAGHPVRVIGRRAEALAALRDAGAEIAVGDAADAAFLAGAFAGATAVYTMIPPNYGAADPRAEQAKIGQAIVDGLRRSGVRRVVNLSSGGAHLPSGTGPIAGLHDQEQRLNAVPGLSLLHLRPGYFFENFFAAAGLIKAFGVYPSMEDSAAVVPMVATADIATVIARELLAGGEPGVRVLHLRAAARLNMADAARVLGRAIDLPELAHVRANPADAKAGMIQHGFSPATAELFEEMSNAFNSGAIVAGFEQGPTETAPTSLADFAPRFAEVYRRLGG